MLALRDLTSLFSSKVENLYDGIFALSESREINHVQGKKDMRISWDHKFLSVAKQWTKNI